MDYQEIIKQLIELEEYFDEGRKKAYKLRIEIQGSDSPAPLEEHETEEAKLAKLLSKKPNGKPSDKKRSSDKTDDEDRVSVVE